MSCDVSDLVSVEEFVKDLMKKYSKVDILINNAGVMHVQDK